MWRRGFLVRRVFRDSEALRQLTHRHLGRHLRAALSWEGRGSVEAGPQSPPLSSNWSPAAAVALASTSSPPRRPEAQRVARLRCGPRSPRLPGPRRRCSPRRPQPAGRRDGPQDGQGQYRPHVRQEPAGSGPWHPQPQGGRGEPARSWAARLFPTASGPPWSLLLDPIAIPVLPALELRLCTASPSPALSLPAAVPVGLKQTLSKRLRHLL